MTEEQYTIRDGNDQVLKVKLKRDKRLRRTLRWERLPDGSLQVRVPIRLPKRSIGPMLEKIRGQLAKSAVTYKRRTDEDLHRRAEQINKTCFGGKVQWKVIRWVGNMNTLLGSCSHGGGTDGEIRINDKIKDWPGWVLDYVIAHELMHRLHPNHSADFWRDLASAYPLAERARGFIRGVGFARGHPLDDAQDD
jgi:predicted metal-dependent hydrolase